MHAVEASQLHQRFNARLASAVLAPLACSIQQQASLTLHRGTRLPAPAFRRGCLLIEPAGNANNPSVPMDVQLVFSKYFPRGVSTSYGARGQPPIMGGAVGPGSTSARRPIPGTDHGASTANVAIWRGWWIFERGTMRQNRHGDIHGAGNIHWHQQHAGNIPVPLFHCFTIFNSNT